VFKATVRLWNTNPEPVVAYTFIIPSCANDELVDALNGFTLSTEMKFGFMKIIGNRRMLSP
jgi:hypothetical protein